VSTFPLRYLSKNTQQKIRDVHTAIKVEQDVQLKLQRERDSKITPVTKKLESDSGSDKNSDTSQKKGTTLSKLEERKKRRQQREVEWDNFLETKPDDK
jgi:hypothetical protein